MRQLLVVLSAAVTAGLVVFFSFNAMRAIAVLQGNVLISLDIFVAFIAVLTLVASALALAYRHLLLRSDRRQLQELSDRVARLEAGSPTA